MAEVRVDPDKCTGCGICEDVCPYDCITLEDGIPVIGEGCTLCAACIEACPAEALRIVRKARSVDTSPYKGVLVFGEQVDGRISPVVYELLGKGRELAAKLGEELMCAILGHEMGEASAEVAGYGLSRVFVYDDQKLSAFRDDPYTDLLADLIEDIKPGIVLIGATNLGRSLAPRLAVKLGTGLTADCTGLDIDDQGNLLQTRPAFGGNVMATILCENHRPQMATVRYKVMKPAEKEGPPGEVIVRELDWASLRDRAELLDSATESGEASITETEIIVSGGMGLGKPEGFRLIAELAELLGGAVGASRSVVDEGWIPYRHQVGLSGRTVRPKLYVACGISGSVQHLAGMATSDTIVAINKDPSAPIFRVADYGIVGDLYEVLPKIIDELRK